MAIIATSTTTHEAKNVERIRRAGLAGRENKDNA